MKRWYSSYLASLPPFNIYKKRKFPLESIHWPLLLLFQGENKNNPHKSFINYNNNNDDDDDDSANGTVVWMYGLYLFLNAILLWNLLMLL